MITSTELSKYRQCLRQLIDRIDKMAYQCAYSDALIQGTPSEVFRTCGQKNCQCLSDRSKRHGPYLVVQTYQDKKQRQFAIRQDQKEIWQKAKNYQKQMTTLSELKKTCKALTDTVNEIIKQRLEKLEK